MVPTTRYVHICMTDSALVLKYRNSRVKSRPGNYFFVYLNQIIIIARDTPNVNSCSLYGFDGTANMSTNRSTEHVFKLWNKLLLVVTFIFNVFSLRMLSMKRQR